jgi:hypothetical protein
MANTTVSIRERIKTADGRWAWSQKIPTPTGKLKPAEAERRGKFYLVWTEKGKKTETNVKGKTFEAAVKAARAKERHLEDHADGFSRPDPLQPNERKTITENAICNGWSLRRTRKHSKPTSNRCANSKAGQLSPTWMRSITTT